MSGVRANSKLVFHSVAVVDAAMIEETTASCDTTVSCNFFTVFDRAFVLFEDWTRKVNVLKWLPLIPCILPAIFYSIAQPSGTTKLASY